MFNTVGLHVSYIKCKKEFLTGIFSKILHFYIERCWDYKWSYHWRPWIQLYWKLCKITSNILFVCSMSSVCMGSMFNKVFGVDCWIIFRSIFLSEATSNNFILQYWRLRRFRNLWKTWSTLPLMFLTWSWIKDGSKRKILLSWNNPNIAFINSDILMVLIVSARTSCSWQ